MTISEHPGFSQALAECNLTAYEAIVVQEAVAILEEWFADFSQFSRACGPDHRPLPQDQEAYPTSPAHLSLMCIASSLRQTLASLASSPLPVDPRLQMTASEIIAYDAARVDLNSSVEAPRRSPAGDESRAGFVLRTGAASHGQE